MSSNVVHQFEAISNDLVTSLISALDALQLPDEQPVFFYPGTSEYKTYWQTCPDKMTALCSQLDKVNRYEYNAIFILRNGEREKGLDHPRYGPQACISLGSSVGNRLCLDGDYIDDHNRLVIFDGTKIPYETDKQLSGDLYRIHFFKISSQGRRSRRQT